MEHYHQLSPSSKKIQVTTDMVALFPQYNIYKISTYNNNINAASLQKFTNLKRYLWLLLKAKTIVPGLGGLFFAGLNSRKYYNIIGPGFRKPPLERTSFRKGEFSSFGKATLKSSFIKAPLTHSPPIRWITPGTSHNSRAPICQVYNPAHICGRYGWVSPW